MQEAGYNTYYTGKMMNGHSTTTYNNPRMAGWNGSDFLLDPGTYIFYNTTMSRNHEPYRNLPGQYSTDLISAAALGFLDEAIAAANDRPFFLGIAPIAPHSETIMQAGPSIFNPPVPAKRHEHLFENVTVPRTPCFNPDTPGSASYRKALRQLNQTELDYNDHWYRRRLQSLQSVDDLITSLLARLNANPQVLQTTYLIYTTDNGFHLGQHRLPPGKSTNIEHDINIPFFIRGPGIPKNKISNIPTSHTDLVPTIFQLAGIPQRADFDGAPVPVRVSDAAVAAPDDRGEHVNVEFWGGYAVEGNAFYGRDRWGGNTYKSVRVVGGEDGGFDLSFTVWCTNEVELPIPTNSQTSTHSPTQPPPPSPPTTTSPPA
ncbi:hypothetical protein J1614_007044 [Plenodomus biglobosus]|nr:hypothetical protein J1614_007044 [Plenodomus biglobosus]